MESLINLLGDIFADSHGNIRPDGDFNLEKLSSFIIIKDEEIPGAENFLDQDMYLVIPIKDEE